MVKLTRKYKKKNSRTKSMKKHKVSKKSRKSRNKKIIHIKKNSRKQKRVGGGGDGDSDDELSKIESGKSRIYSISGDPDDIEGGRESITLVRERKNQIPSVKPYPTARNQSPFVSIFSRVQESWGDLTKSISSPYSRKISNISPNISSSSADSEEGGVTNTNLYPKKYDEELSEVQVHSQDYITYLGKNKNKNTLLSPVVFDSQQNRFSKFLDNSGYTGSEKEDLMNKLTDPDFINSLDTIMDKMITTQIERKHIRENLLNEGQRNAKISLRKDILKNKGRK